MNKLLTLFMTLFMLGIFAMPAHAIGIKRNSVIEDGTIKLGDIFYGLSYNAERILGPAPRPGQDMILNAKTLLRIARATDVPWRPMNLNDQVVLRRAATLIDSKQIEKGLVEEMKHDGLQGKFTLSFPKETSEMILPLDQPASFDIEKLEHNIERDWFRAELVAPSSDNPIQRVTVTGSIDRLIDVPVLSNSKRNGSVIRANDIEIIEVPIRQIKGDVVLAPEDLMGMSPRRIVFSGKPIKTQELIAPQIIDRGESITVSYRNGILNLSAQGRALESGAKGDTIRVVNTASSQTLDAVVIGEKEVQVSSF